MRQFLARRQTASRPSLSYSLTRTVLALLAIALVAGGCAGTPGPLWRDPKPQSPTEEAFVGWSNPNRVGKPWGKAVSGLLTFRGNPTRTFYGTGPVPRTKPQLLWRYPDYAMCGTSSDERGPREWCGTGWTGQPAVFERDGRTWVVFGAYDYKVHFVDAETGEDIIPPFPTGDIIKGSVTIDPDGYPLVYTGSRDNYYRILAIDGDRPRELWKLSAYAVSPTMFNNDWDGAGLIIDDYLFEGGENSQIHIVKLNRGYDANGKVTVNPKLVFNAPGWDAELLRNLSTNNISIENSVAIYKNTLYFSNSGGLVQGWDISGLKDGVTPTRVFRYWVGDDTDATITIDEEGMLYVGAEYARPTKRSAEVGQMIKLDPSREDPLVWQVFDRRTRLDSGILATPALHRDIVIYGTDHGDVLGIDRMTGEVRWKFYHFRVWSSLVVVDDVLIVCDGTGAFHAYDVADTHAQPKHLWTVNTGSVIESTPAVWKGKIYFGNRGGHVYAFGAEQP